LIHVSNPIFVLVFAAILIRERISLLKVLGIILGATGAVILILYRGKLSFGSDTFTGNFLAMINMMAYAVYLVIIKPVMAKYSPITVMKWVFLLGFIFTAPFTVGSLGAVELQVFDMRGILSVIYVVVATTFLAYLLTIYALKYVDASVAGFYIYLQPLIVAIIAYWLGQQPVTWEKGVAAALIFAGVYMVSRRNSTA
ncbi:MAG: DMT family transporter, partial [Bacteroidota bacterium]